MRVTLTLTNTILWSSYVQWHQNEFESGGTDRARKSGGTVPAQNARKNFFGRASPLFGYKSTISSFFAVLLLMVPARV